MLGGPSRRVGVRVASSAHGPALLGARRRGAPGPRLHGRPGRPSLRGARPGSRSSGRGSRGRWPRRARTRGPSSRTSRATSRTGSSPTGGPRYFGFVIGGALPVAHRGGLADGGVGPERAAATSSPRRCRWSRRSPRAGSASCSGCPPAAGWASSPAARWRTSRAWRPRGTPSCATRAGTSRPTGCRARREVRVIAGEQAHVTIAVACRMLGLGADRRAPRFAADDQGRMRAGALRDALAEQRRADDRLRAGGRDQHGRLRPARRDRRRLPRARRVVPRRRRLRPVGGGQPRAARAARRRRARRLLGDRRAQVAERPLRLRHRGRRRRRGAPRGDDARRPRTSRPTPTTSPGASTGRPSSRAAHAACRSTRRCARSAATASPSWSTAPASTPGGWPTRLRAAAASRSSTTSCSTRCSCASPTTTR